MSNNQVFVLHLFRNKGILYSVGNNDKETLFGFEWDDNEGLGQFLKKVKETVKSRKIKILLDDNICYFFKLKTKSAQKIDQELVFQKISKEVPEDLTLSDWTFKEIVDNDKNIQLIAFAPIKQFNDYFQTQIEQLSLSVDLMAPLRLVSENGEDPIIALVKEGEVEIKAEESKTLDSNRGFVVDNNKFNYKAMIVFVCSVVVILIGVFGFFYFNQSSGEIKSPVEESSQMIEQSPSIEPTMTPSLNEKIAREEISIKILNGSGAVGLASQAEAVLLDLGYKNIEIGNAENYDYQLGVIRVKEDESAVSLLIREDLKGDYSFEEEDEVLSETSPYDVIIVISG